jgi:hypothetical protein
MWSRVVKMIMAPEAIGAIPLAFVVMFGGYFSYRYNMVLKGNHDLVVHTHELISAIERAFSDIQGAETRGLGDG